MKRLILIFISLIALCSCSSNNDDPKYAAVGITPYLISNYLLLEKITCTQSDLYNNEVYLRYYGENCGDKFSYFNKLYNDTSFNKGNYPGAHQALAYPIDKITLSCDSDYDDKHPAGTPLDDIVKLKYTSYLDFIHNDYQYPEGYKKEEGYRLGEILFEYYLSEINNDNTKLASRAVSTITFTELPTVAGEYNFTLELTSNGETLTTTFTHVFDDQKKIY